MGTYNYLRMIKNLLGLGAFASSSETDGNSSTDSPPPTCEQITTAQGNAGACDVASVDDVSICAQVYNDGVYSCQSFELQKPFPVAGATDCASYTLLNFVQGFIAQDVMTNDDTYEELVGKLVFSKEMSDRLCPITFNGENKSDTKCVAVDDFSDLPLPEYNVNAPGANFCKA